MRTVIIFYADGGKISEDMSEKTVEALQKRLADPTKRWFRIVNNESQEEMWLSLTQIKHIHFGVPRST